MIGSYWLIPHASVEKDKKHVPLRRCVFSGSNVHSYAKSTRIYAHEHVAIYAHVATQVNLEEVLYFAS